MRYATRYMSEYQHFWNHRRPVSLPKPFNSFSVAGQFITTHLATHSALETTVNPQAPTQGTGGRHLSYPGPIPSPARCRGR
jgi:hypothetical protein